MVALLLGLATAGCGGSPPTRAGDDPDLADDLVGGGDRAVLTGSVSLGPLCPVETVPPDPVCLPRPEHFATLKLLISRPGAAWTQAVDLDGSGGFTVELDPGSYTIDSNVLRGGAGEPGGGGFPSDTLPPPIPTPLPAPRDPDAPDSSGGVVPEPPHSWPDTVWPLPEPPLPLPLPDSAPGGEPGARGPEPAPPGGPVDTLPTPPRGSGEERVTLPAVVDLVAGKVRRLHIDIDTGIR